MVRKRLRGFMIPAAGLTMLVISVTGIIQTASAETCGDQFSSVADVIRKCGPKTDAALKPLFKAADAKYPPQKLTLIVLKNEWALELWADGKYIKTYEMTGNSGHPGPKLKEWDGQIPEGIYPVGMLNPFSNFHLSMLVGYPNSFDRARAKEDGRTKLGGAIMIHGSYVTIGCIPIGDEPIEELFTLVAKTGKENVKIILLPNDIRNGDAFMRPDVPPKWLQMLHDELRKAVEPYKHPEGWSLYNTEIDSRSGVTGEGADEAPDGFPCDGQCDQPCNNPYETHHPDQPPEEFFLFESVPE